MRNSRFAGLILAIAGALLVFLYAPLLPLLIFSFNSSRLAVWSGFSLDWYRTALGDPLLIESTMNSLIIAAVSTLLTTLIGTFGAYELWKRKAPVLVNLLYLSLVVPEIVTGVATLVLFQFLFRFFDWHLGMWTVVLAHVAFSLAYSVTVILARLRTLDPALEEAAKDLGATSLATFLHVTLPIMAPGIMAAALLCFTVSFDDYVITSMVAGVDSQTLPMLIYSMARKGVNPEVNAISALLMVSLGVLILFATRYQGEPGSNAQ